MGCVAWILRPADGQGREWDLLTGEIHNLILATFLYGVLLNLIYLAEHYNSAAGQVSGFEARNVLKI